MAQQNDSEKCPNCDGDQCSLVDDDHEFPYRIGEKQFILTARFPVITCQGCNFSWSDWRAEDATGIAVRSFLHNRVRSLEIAVKGLIDAMEMQEGRETEELHIPQHTARVIWDSAKATARRLLNGEE